MTVGIVGTGPAVAAVEAALGDVDVDTVTGTLDEVAGEELLVVAGQAGDTVFEQASERALETDQRWVAAELGGVGGIPIVDAAVAGFGPETGCYECLSGRVSANLDPQAEPAAAPPAHTTRFAGAVAGREAARYVTGDADIFGRVVVVPFTEREFLPLPNCACDEGPETRVRRDYTERSTEDALARAERALDDQLGIVQEVGEAESFPAPYYLAQSCDTSGFSDVSAARNAAGVAADWNGAFMKALGEGLERYCAGIYHVEAFETATADELSDAVPPSAFVCEHESDDDTEVPWVEGQRLDTEASAMLPAEFVYYPPPTTQFRSAVTTGLGLGNSGTEALLAGLYEVIERDAMMLSWYSSFDPLALDVDDEEYQTLVTRARSEGLSVTALLLTQDVDVPVVAAAVYRDEWPKFAIGTGADLSVASAAESALGEALQNWMELRGMGQEDAERAMGEIGRYAGFPEEASAFIDAETTIPATSAGPNERPDGKEELAELLERVADADLTAYGVRTTTRDVAQLGFEAVRVLVPAAQPLCFDDIYFGDRAETVPGDLGFDPEFDRNHHPFP